MKATEPPSALQILRRRLNPSTTETPDKQGEMDLQVTVAIALPSRATSANDGGLEYCLGVFREKTTSNDDWNDLDRDAS